MHHDSDTGTGIRVALPIVLPTLALGASFGVIARPTLGPFAPIVMSVVVFSGGAQFAALSVLQGGGASIAAISAGMLMNTRWLPMSFAVAPSLRGGRLRRSVESQAVVDASFVLAGRRDGTFDRGLLIGATVAQAISWVTGTVVGVLASNAIPDPGRFGLDAIFPAFYLALLVHELDTSRARTVAMAAAAITLPLTAIAPPGVPIIAASAAALLGLRPERST